MQFITAKRPPVKLRIHLNSPSGYGKTKSALLMARGLCDGWEEIAVIDTERGSALIYTEELGPFAHLDFLPPYSPDRFVQAFEAAAAAGYKVLVVDSGSHEWMGTGGMLQMTGDQFQNWSKTNPHHDRFVNAILSYPGHVILTTRSKAEYVVEDDPYRPGKKKVVKLGTKPVQRDGLEFEMTVSIDLVAQFVRDGEGRAVPNAATTKNRTNLFLDGTLFTINEQTGRDLRRWAENPPPLLSEADGLTKIAAAPDLAALEAVCKDPDHRHLYRPGSAFAIAAKARKRAIEDPLAEAAARLASGATDTVAVAALAEGRQSLGVELNPAYAEAVANRPGFPNGAAQGPPRRPDPAEGLSPSTDFDAPRTPEQLVRHLADQTPDAPAEPEPMMTDAQRAEIEELLTSPHIRAGEKAATEKALPTYNEVRAGECITNLKATIEDRATLVRVRSGINTALAAGGDKLTEDIRGKLTAALTDQKMTGKEAQKLLKLANELIHGKTITPANKLPALPGAKDTRTLEEIDRQVARDAADLGPDLGKTPGSLGGRSNSGATTTGRGGRRG